MLLLGMVVLLLFGIHITNGPVPLTLHQVWAAITGEATDPVLPAIVLGVRIPQALTALLAGGGLALSGLLMQTLFRNPLAGPSVLGISSGAALAVALVMMAGTVLRIPGSSSAWAVVVAAMIGAFAVLLVILAADRRVGGSTTLLIIGLMVGYLCSALVSVLQLSSGAAMLKGFVVWGMGSFATVGPDRLPFLAVPVLLGTVAALLLMKPLNALLMGDLQASSMGTSVRRAKRTIILVTGLLAGTITAFCGPIAFLGLATPHVARALLGTSDHARLLPATLLTGALLALLCDLVVRLPATGQHLPLNAVTSLLGAPVVLWVLLRGRKWSSAV